MVTVYQPWKRVVPAWMVKGSEEDDRAKCINNFSIIYWPADWSFALHARLKFRIRRLEF